MNTYFYTIVFLTNKGMVGAKRVKTHTRNEYAILANADLQMEDFSPNDFAVDVKLFRTDAHTETEQRNIENAIEQLHNENMEKIA